MTGEPEFPRDWRTALRQLEAGNDRHRSTRQARPNQSPVWHGELSRGQWPRALVLGCADSRVPPELIFDQGPGDLFVVRVAGNILDDVVLGSVEFAAEQLGVELAVVLGHSDCGALAATLQGRATAGHLPFIADAITPALEAARADGLLPLGRDAAAVDQAARVNARYVAAKLAATGPLLSELSGAGRLTVRPAYYDLDTGAVEWL